MLCKKSMQHNSKQKDNLHLQTAVKPEKSHSKAFLLFFFFTFFFYLRPLGRLRNWEGLMYPDKGGVKAPTDHCFTVRKRSGHTF